MKRILLFFALVLCLAGCGGGNPSAAVDTGSGAASAQEDGSYDLGAASLTAASKELPGCLFYTNSTEITVRTDDARADGTVYLTLDGEDIQEHAFSGKGKVTFRNLTAAKRYGLRADGVEVTYTVTD